MTQTQLQGRENLSDATSKFLFTQCLNNIDHALAGAREAAEIKPSERNILIVEQLEEFYELNKEFYQEAKEYFNKNMDSNDK